VNTHWRSDVTISAHRARMPLGQSEDVGWVQPGVHTGQDATFGGGRRPVPLSNSAAYLTLMASNWPVTDMVVGPLPNVIDPVILDQIGRILRRSEGRIILGHLSSVICFFTF
jgi:hypothetical protein